MTSLDSATYVVPDHGFGVIHNLPVGDVSPEVFSELLESTAAEGGYFSAELGPRSTQEGFAVRIDDSLVGHLSAADSQAYALFDWILSAGLHPHATAHVSMTDASGEEWPTLNLFLPAPHLCIPANNPPAQRWTMLPGESAATLTEFSKDVTGFPQTDEHYLVSLHTRGFLRRNTVDVYVNSTFLGSLPRDAAREIAPAVLDCTKSGRLAIAHGYFHYNADDRPALTIYAHNAANKHHAGLVLGIVAGGAAIMSAATAARAQAAPAVPGGTTAGASATSGFSVTSAAGAAGASGAVTSNLLAAAGVAVLVGGGATVATNLLSDDEALSDTNAPSTAPAPEGNHSSHFDGNGPKRPAHPATPRIHDAGPTSGTSAQPPLADAPSSPAPHHHTSLSQTTKKPSATHSPHADHAQTHAPASDNRRGHHSEPRGGHRGEDSQAISRAASAAAAAAMAAANDVASAPAPAPAPSQTTPASTPSSSSEPAPQVAAAKKPTATSSSSQSAEPSQTTESTKSTTSAEPSSAASSPAEPSSAASSPAEPSDLPTSSTSTSEKTTSEKTTAETTTAASTEKQTTEPSSSATSSATSEPTSEPTQAADPSTPTSASSTSTSAQSEPESSEPASSEPKPSESTAPTTTIPGSEIDPTPEPEITVELEPALPTTYRSAPDGPAEPAEPEEPGRPEEPEEPTTPPKVIVIVVEN